MDGPRHYDVLKLDVGLLCRGKSPASRITFDGGDIQRLGPGYVHIVACCIAYHGRELVVLDVPGRFFLPAFYPAQVVTEYPVVRHPGFCCVETDIVRW